jgi:hypothetical protein
MNNKSLIIPLFLIYTVSFAIVYGWELQLLNGFPQRYEDLASLLKEGIRGPMTFLENGFDSQFYVEFGQGDKIWFERY